MQFTDLFIPLLNGILEATEKGSQAFKVLIIVLIIFEIPASLYLSFVLDFKI